MKSRKPSVLVSRRFSCSEALNLKHLRPITSRKEKSEDQPRLIENAKDVTPRPLVQRDLPSIQDISIFGHDEDEVVDGDNDDGDDSDSSSGESVLDDLPMPWIPKLVGDIMESGKNILINRVLFLSR